MARNSTWLSLLTLTTAIGLASPGFAQSTDANSMPSIEINLDALKGTATAPIPVVPQAPMAAPTTTSPFPVVPAAPVAAQPGKPKLIWQKGPEGIPVKAKPEPKRKPKPKVDKKAEAEKQAKAEAEKKAKMEAEAKAEVEKKAKMEAEAKAKAAAEAQAKAEEEAKAKAAAEAEKQKNETATAVPPVNVEESKPEATPPAPPPPAGAVPPPPPPPPPPAGEQPPAPPPPPITPTGPAETPSKPVDLVPMGQAPAAPVAPVEANPPASNTPGKADLSIAFRATETALPLSVKDQVDAVIAKLKADDSLRINLIAYASANADQASTARRVSLSRALAVRAYLIDSGIGNLRINVQAEGDKNPGGEPDRVDMFLVK